jgi:hypothetical protein
VDYETLLQDPVIAAAVEQNISANRKSKPSKRDQKRTPPPKKEQLNNIGNSPTQANAKKPTS